MRASVALPPRLTPTACANVGKRLGDFEIPMLALEVRVTRKSVVRSDDGIFFRRQKSRHLIAIPNIEFAFLVLGIGIQSGVIAPADGF